MCSVRPMRLVVAGLLFCTWCVCEVTCTHWELQSLDVPSSHIPYFMRGKPYGQEFCKDSDCQVHNIITSSWEEREGAKTLKFRVRVIG